MKMLDAKLVSLIIVPFLYLPIYSSHGGELSGKPQGVKQLFYPSYSVNTLLKQAKTSSAEPSNINWFLNNLI